MTTDTLGPGSGRPGISRELGDFTVASLAIRSLDHTPTDEDWPEPPPNNTLALEGTFLWARIAGTWVCLNSKSA